MTMLCCGASERDAAARFQAGSLPVTPMLNAVNDTSRRPCDGHAFSLHLERHLSFNVVKLNKAKMIDTMTKRVITLGSLQPISSKWW